MKSICPLMSRPMYSRNAQSLYVHEVDCVEGKCQFWITAYTTEGRSIEGCAKALAPQMHEGLLRV